MKKIVLLSILFTASIMLCLFGCKEKPLITITNQVKELQHGDAVTAQWKEDNENEILFKIEPAVEGISINSQTGIVTYSDSVTEGTNYNVIAYYGEIKSPAVKFSVRIIPVDDLYLTIQSTDVIHGNQIETDTNIPASLLEYKIEPAVNGIYVDDGGIVSYASFIGDKTPFTVFVSKGEISVSKSLKASVPPNYFDDGQTFVLNMEKSEVTNLDYDVTMPLSEVGILERATITFNTTSTDGGILGTYNALITTAIPIGQSAAGNYERFGPYSFDGNIGTGRQGEMTFEFEVTVMPDFSLRLEFEFEANVPDYGNVLLNVVCDSVDTEQEYFENDTSYEIDFDLSGENAGELFENAAIQFDTEGGAVITMQLADSNEQILDCSYSLFGYNNIIAIIENIEEIEEEEEEEGEEEDIATAIYIINTNVIFTQVEIDDTVYDLYFVKA